MLVYSCVIPLKSNSASYQIETSSIWIIIYFQTNEDKKIINVLLYCKTAKCMTCQSNTVMAWVYRNVNVKILFESLKFHNTVFDIIEISHLVQMLTYYLIRI